MKPASPTLNPPTLDEQIDRGAVGAKATRWLHAKALRIGAKLALRGNLEKGARRLIQPIQYWRFPEYAFVAEEGAFKSTDLVLDIGSPKLFSLWVAKAVGAELWTTDINSYFIDEFRIIRDIEKIAEDRLHLEVQDGRKLTFPDNRFDKVYSISVIEHIPHDGDTDCIREIGRVLRPGGRAILTVPFWPEARDEFIEPSKIYWSKSSASAGGDKVFFQRRYSEATLHSRLVVPSGLTLKKLVYVGERILTGSERELADMLPGVSGPLHRWLSNWLHTPFSPTWQSLKKPLGAYLVLEKP